jgi:hypothetical protein
VIKFSVRKGGASTGDIKLNTLEPSEFGQATAVTQPIAFRNISGGTQK